MLQFSNLFIHFLNIFGILSTFPTNIYSNIPYKR